jgi:hypothetical protein
MRKQVSGIGVTKGRRPSRRRRAPTCQTRQTYRIQRTDTIARQLRSGVWQEERTFDCHLDRAALCRQDQRPVRRTDRNNTTPRRSRLLVVSETGDLLRSRPVRARTPCPGNPTPLSALNDLTLPILGSPVPGDKKFAWMSVAVPTEGQMDVTLTISE